MVGRLIDVIDDGTYEEDGGVVGVVEGADKNSRSIFGPRFFHCPILSQTSFGLAKCRPSLWGFDSFISF